MWRGWVSQGWINPTNFLILPTVNLGGLHHIHCEGIHKRHTIDTYRHYSYHSHHRDIRTSSLDTVLFADDVASQIVNKGLIPPHFFIFWCNQLLTIFVCILPLVNIYFSRQIQLLKWLVEYLLGCQGHWLKYILLLQDNIDLLTIWI